MNEREKGRLISGVNKREEKHDCFVTDLYTSRGRSEVPQHDARWLAHRHRSPHPHHLVAGDEVSSGLVDRAARDGMGVFARHLLLGPYKGTCGETAQREY